MWLRFTFMVFRYTLVSYINIYSITIHTYLGCILDKRASNAYNEVHLFVACIIIFYWTCRVYLTTEYDDNNVNTSSLLSFMVKVVYFWVYKSFAWKKIRLIATKGTTEVSLFFSFSFTNYFYHQAIMKGQCWWNCRYLHGTCQLYMSVCSGSRYLSDLFNCVSLTIRPSYSTRYLIKPK